MDLTKLNKADEYLQIFPNPTSTKINLQIPKQFGEPNRVQIYSSIGKLIITVEHSLVLDLTTFDKGIYFIVVTNEKGEKLKSIESLI